MKGRAGSLKEHFPITVHVPNLDSLTGHWEFKRSTQCYRTFKDLCIMLGWVTPLTFSKLQINVPINFWFEWNWEFLALLSVRYKKETDETWMPLKRSCKDMLVKSKIPLKIRPTKLTKQLALNVQKNECNEIIIKYYVWQTFAMPSSCKDCIFIWGFEARTRANIELWDKCHSKKAVKQAEEAFKVAMQPSKRKKSQEIFLCHEPVIK